jgi:3-oxoacyl-[acyl-carrier protein] reductase
MNLDLTGRTALVTAATSGIGLATARGLAQQGASLWINGRNQARLDTARDSILEAAPGAKVDTVVADVATAAGCQAVIDAVDDLDILLPMAGGTNNLRPFTELTDDDWQYQWEYNVMQGVRLARHYVPLLLRKDFGRIVFLTSEAGIITPTNIVDYGTVKAAVIRLSRSVAEIFAGTNVTVNCVAPGPTKSEWVYRMADGRPLEEVEAEYFPEAQPTSLLKKFAEAEDVANLICYLCSPASTATRGALLRAEGGSIRTSC